MNKKSLTFLLTIIFLIIFTIGCSNKSQQDISASDQIGKTVTTSIGKGTTEISNANKSPNTISSQTTNTIAKPTNESADQTVYVTDSGGKYHKEGCKYLEKSKHAIKKSEAVEEGYEPCHICKPN